MGLSSSNWTLLLHGMTKFFRYFRDENDRQEGGLGSLTAGLGAFCCRPHVPILFRAIAFRQQSKYFDFRFKQHPEKIQAIARFADAFIDIVNRDFFKAEFDYPIRVLVTEDISTHQTLVSQQFGFTDPTMGV